MENEEKNTLKAESQTAFQGTTQPPIQTPKQKSWLVIGLLVLVLLLLGTTGFFAFQNHQLKKELYETKSQLENLKQTTTPKTDSSSPQPDSTNTDNCRQFIHEFTSYGEQYLVYYESVYSSESGLPDFIIWKKSSSGEKTKIFEEKETPAGPRFIPSAHKTLTILQLSFADTAYYYVLDLIKGESSKIDLRAGYLDHEVPIGWTGTDHRSILVKSITYDESFGTSDENADIYYWSAPYYDLQNKTYYKKSQPSI